jgi:hypothetical protein
VLEKSQPKVWGRAVEVTVGSLPELHKASTLVLGTLHFVGARFCCNKSLCLWCGYPPMVVSPAHDCLHNRILPLYNRSNVVSSH